MAEGETLGKYRIRRTLGRGATGVVLEGWDPIIERRVAIKSVRLDESNDPETREQIDRFRREARAAGQLIHPNIVTIHDYGETDDVAYIVMEFVEGPSLKDVLDLGRMLDQADVIRIMEDILAGLAYSHQHGVIHRDIKPGNVMLTSRDIRTARAKIADYGIARIESSTLTQAGTMMGTPAYMAPEQFLGATIDARSDIYAAGALLYQLLTGQRPFEGTISSIMHQVLTTEARVPSAMVMTVDPVFDAVVMRALAKQPAKRFQYAAAFAEALREAASSQSAKVPDEPSDPTIHAPAVIPVVLPPPSRPIRTATAEGGGTRWSMALAALGLVSALGLGAWLFLGPTRQPRLTDRIVTPPPARVAEATPAEAPPPSGAIPVPAPVTTASTRPPALPAPSPSVPFPATPTPATSVPATSIPAVPVPATPTPGSPAPGSPAPGSPIPPPQAQAATVPSAPSLPAAIPPAPNLPAPNLPAPNLPAPSLPAPSLPAPSLPAPSLPAPSLPAANLPAAGLPATSLPPSAPPPSIPPSSAPSASPQAPPAAANPAQPMPAPSSPDPSSPNPSSPDPASPAQPAAVQPGSLPSSPGLPSAVTAPTAPPPPVVALPPSTGFSPAGAVELARAISGMRCALVDGVTGADGAVLRGVAASGSEAQLRALLTERRAIGRLDWQVRDTDPAFCRTLDLLRPLGPPFDADGPRIRLTLAEDRLVLRAGDAIRPRIIMPAFSAYLQVDYIAHDGTVQHLYPQAADPRQGIRADPVRVFAPSEWVNLGDPAPGQRGWEASEPYGRDMIVTIASSRPLFAVRRPNNAEASDTYLQALEQALRALQQAGAEAAVAAIPVRVTPR